MRIFVVLLLVFSACRSSALPSPAAQADDAGLKKMAITIVSRTGERHALHVELATNFHEREVGLMFRHSLGADDGMLFIFPKSDVQTFWMKNTLIPLDMLFIRSDGTIAGIVREAAPLTETSRTVGKPSLYVLEVNGGWCSVHNVKSGDRLLLDGVPATKE